MTTSKSGTTQGNQTQGQPSSSPTSTPSGSQGYVSGQQAGATSPYGAIAQQYGVEPLVATFVIDHWDGNTAYIKPQDPAYNGKYGFPMHQPFGLALGAEYLKQFQGAAEIMVMYVPVTQQQKQQGYGNFGTTGTTGTTGGQSGQGGTSTTNG